MKLYGKWKVTLPGEQYIWAPDDTTVGETLMIETETGGSFDEWVIGIDKRLAIPCQVFVWFLRHKDGRQEDRMTVDFPIRRLELELIVEEADADPEALAGSAPATLPTSLANTESAPGNGADSPELTSVG